MLERKYTRVRKPTDFVLLEEFHPLPVRRDGGQDCRGLHCRRAVLGLWQPKHNHRWHNRDINAPKWKTYPIITISSTEIWQKGLGAYLYHAWCVRNTRSSKELSEKEGWLKMRMRKCTFYRKGTKWDEMEQNWKNWSRGKTIKLIVIWVA